MSKDTQPVFRLQYDLSHFEQHNADPNSSGATRTARSTMGVNEMALYEKSRIPQVVLDKKMNTNLFVKGITTYAKAKDHFVFLEALYKVDVLNSMSPGYRPEAMTTITRYVNGDLLGTEGNPGLNDTVFWKNGTRQQTGRYSASHADPAKRGKRYTVTKSTKILTKIGGGVKYAQQEIYEMLRGSVRLYMIKATWQLVDAAIKKAESALTSPKINDSNFLTAKNRITWDWIKKWISEHLCTLTLGSYHFRPLYLVYRFNGEPRHKWMHRLSEIYAAVVNYAQGWDKIGSKDFLRKCWIWFGDDEKKVTRSAFKEQADPKRKYRTDTALIQGETFAAFRDFVNDIEPFSFSAAAFKITWCKEGLAELLYTRQFVVNLMQERDADKKRIKDLEAKLRGQTSGNSNQTNANRKKRTGDKSPNADPKGANADGNKPNGQPPFCQKCAKVGLKRRHFVCDPKKRAEGVLKRQNAEREKKGYKIRNGDPKTRKYPLESYSKDSCEFCKAADQNPVFSISHKKDTCFLRPNGPVQQKLGITYKQMIHQSRKQDWMKAKQEIHREMREAAKKRAAEAEKIEAKQKARENTSVMRTPAEGDSYGTTETARRSDDASPVGAKKKKQRLSKKRRKREKSKSKDQDKPDPKGKGKPKGKAKGKPKAKATETPKGPEKRKRPDEERVLRNPNYVPYCERRKPRNDAEQIPNRILDYVIEQEGYNAYTQKEREELYVGLRLRYAHDPTELAFIKEQYNDKRTDEIRQLKAKLAMAQAKAAVNEAAASSSAPNSSDGPSGTCADTSRVTFSDPIEQTEYYDAQNDHLNQSDGDQDQHDSSANQDTSELFGNTSPEPFQDEFTSEGAEYIHNPGEDPMEDCAPNMDSDSGDEDVRPCNASVEPNLTHARTHTGHAGGRLSLPVLRLRRKRSKGDPKRVMTVPLEPWCPATRVVNPIARTCFTANAKPIDFDPFKSDCDQESSRARRRKRTRTRKPLSSEKPGWRLLQAYTQYRDATGAIKVGRVQLDSHSNVNYSLPGISLRRQWGPNEKSTVIGVSKQPVKLGQPLSFTILKEDTPIVIDTNEPIGGKLSDDCVALLGLDAINLLGIDLNHAVRNNRHVWIKYIDSKQDTVERCDQAKDDIVHEHAAPLTPKDLMQHGSTFLSERVIDAYNQAHPAEFEVKPIPIESVEIDPDMPAEWQKKFRDDIKERREAFATHTNQLPKCMNGIPPYMFKLKPGAETVQVPRPKFGPAKTKLIMRWVEWAASKEVGLIKPAGNAAYSSRLILAAKYKHDTPKSAPPDGIRVAWAGVGVNETIVKAVPTYPDAYSQIYKVARKTYKFTADGLKQYWTIPLSEKAQEMTAFWTPRGLYKFTRMVMGTKNAATIAQNAYMSAMHTKLNPRSYPNIALWADDFMGGGDDYAELNRTFRDFLDMVIAAGITLNPKKVRVGFKRETWYGMTIEEGRISPSDRNLDPVKNMVYPRNRSELRAVMGVFNQFSHFIDHYMAKGSPADTLSQLTSTKVPYVFTKEHEQALEALRKLILSGVHLWTQDPDIPLQLETDGSDDGWGAVLFQMVEGERRVIKMWSKKWDTEAWHKKPPYHREAKAWMNGMELSMPYTLFNKHPIECYTDHSPLTWIKHTSGKGPVSQFIIDKLSLVDYNMHYIRGPDNKVADALSRYPMLGPRTLTRTGLKRSLDVLLASLVSSYPLNATRVWLDAGKDSVFLSEEVYAWREATHNIPRNAKHLYLNHLSEATIKKVPYTFGIWAPYADKVTHQCLAAYKKGIPFACLLPGELVCFIAKEKDGTYNEQIARMVRDSGKISFLDTGLVWLIHGVKPVRRVLTAERFTLEPSPEHMHTFVGEVQRVLPDPQQNLDELMRHLRSTNLTPPVDMCRTRQEWIQLQAEHRIPIIWQGKAERTQDGLWFVYGKDRLPRTIVPRALQLPLIRWKHHAMCHIGWKKIYNSLAKQFHWENMQAMVKKEVLSCHLCAVLKGRMQLANKHFRAKLFCTPRTSYGSDYYGVKMNAQGYCAILGIIDLATGHLVLKAAKSASGAHVAHTLFYKIVLVKGVPLLFHTDAAQAFLGKAVTALSDMLGIKRTDTLAHNPKSNAKMERVWEFVGRCLKTMSREQYADFPKMLPIMEHVWNDAIDSETGVSPFEAEHGMPMRGVAEALLENPPREGLPACANDLRTIAKSARAYAEHLARVKAVEKALAAMRLNAKGYSKHEYHLGDRVAFFLPPTVKQAQALGKNPKHLLHFAGPAEIVESLSEHGTSWKLEYNGRQYRRNVMHMVPYRPDDFVEHQQRAVVDNTVYLNSYVAVLDNDDDDNYHVAKVIGLTAQETTLHYMGTSSKTLRSAKWRLMYHRLDGEGLQWDNPNTITHRHTPLTGTIDTRPIEDSLIILPNLGFTEQGRLNKDTQAVLNSYPQKHHVYRRTWQ